MILVNEMFGDPNSSICLSGICIKKAYPYIKYVKIENQTTCTDSLVQDIAYIKNGLYVELYKNPNPLYHTNTGDTSLCLVISESIVDWVENYLNLIATTGYEGNLPSQFETRVIYDSTIGVYFKLVHTQNSVACSGDTEPVLAVYDNITDDVWISGGANNYWFTEDGFDKVDSLDINPNSPTYDHIITVFKCIVCDLGLSITSQNAHNGDHDGTATATPNNGLAPYTYLWSNGQTTQTAINLSGNVTYNVLVTDSKGCTITGSTLIGECDMLLNITGTTGSGSNGTARAMPSNGVAPYTYLWSDGQTTQFATNLTGGVQYSVTATDSVGCNVNGSITIPECNLGLNVTQTAANGSNHDGTATATPSNGIAPYTYLWSNGQTTQTATGLTGGVRYDVSVTDNIGCSVSGNVTVSIACNLSVQFTSTNPDNFANNNGTATVTVNGGVSPYNYTWSNGQVVNGSTSNVNTATNLSGSTEYSLTVVDGNGCTMSGNITVGQSTFTFDTDYMVLTYAFTDGLDLDTRTRVVTPNIGQTQETDYLGWGVKTYYPLTASGDTINNAILYWGGDNTGIGNEAVLINLIRFKELYPSETNIVIDCRGQWYNTNGVQDVFISAKLYKGGVMTRQLDTGSGYNFNNSGYTETYDIASVGKVVTLHSTATTSGGERIATLTYDLTTNSGFFDNNDVTTPSV